MRYGIRRLRDLSIAVYRVLLPDGRAQGYALGPVGHVELLVAIDPERDYAEQPQVHVFHCEEAARAFQWA